MKITDVTLTLFAWEGIPALSYGAHAAASGGRSRLGLLTIRTDEGVEGHGFLGSATNPADAEAASLIRALKPRIMGQDPLDRERLNALLWARVRQTSPRAIGVIDVALWDIAGKVAGLPVHRLMGSYRDAIPAYASSEVLPSAAAYAEQAAQFKEGGWAAYKIHPPQREKEDIAICAAVRRAVGQDYTLMLDSTWGYDYPTALRVGRAIEEMEYHWYEDPLADQDIYNYVKLRQALRVPIMATEYPMAGLDSYAIWLTERATDYLRGDVAVKGGITTVLKTAHLAEAFRMNYEIHHGGNSLNNLANLHVAMAIRNTTWFEVLLPEAAQKYGLLEEIEIGRDGMVRPPSGPGLGAAIDFELIGRKTEAVLS
ncbi:MAG: mandelate racemase [Alphaproteobacteria bacterium]|nr:mandelate racemase [Alphaproteobacteria bacterium]